MKLTAPFAAMALTIISLSVGAAEFPEGATTPTADDIKARLAGKTITAKLPSGATWKVDYKGDGSFVIETSNGFYDPTGKWTTQDGKLCSEGRKIKANCTEVRVKGDDFFMQRENGDVVQFVTVK